MQRMVSVLLVVALMATMMTASAMPALAKQATYKAYGQEEWYLLTGQNSEYGGTYCTRR